MISKGQEYKMEADIDLVLEELSSELWFAYNKFPNMRSAHEGYAIIKEEVDELWDAIKNNKTSTLEERRKEALQVAAMAIRYILDVE